MSAKPYYLAKKHHFNLLKKHELYLKHNAAPKRPKIYLIVSLISFLIFFWCLTRANQSFPASQINAQVPKLTHAGLDLIREQEHFEKFDQNQITIKDPSPIPTPTKRPDPRLAVLQKYLSQFDSPLKDHAQDFLDAADTYQIDWRLVPSIAGVESTFGKAIPGGHDPKFSSYNGWGWGVYGDQVIKFKSWREAIFAVTKGLKTDYLDQGLTDPFSINTKYAASPSWAGHLSYFLNDLADFAQNHPDKPTLTTPQQIQNLVFQQYAYLKIEDNHFSLQFSE